MADLKMVKVKLLAPHEHAGVVYNEGDVIELDEATAKWLFDLKGCTPPLTNDETKE